MKRRGFTLIELLVVIAIIAVLAAILFPVLTSAKEKGRQTQCANNLKQLTMAVFRYCDDNNGCTPNACTTSLNGVIWVDWAGCPNTQNPPERLNHVRDGGLWDYVRNEKVYSCPSGRKGVQLSYSMNQWIGAESWKPDGIRKLEPEIVGRGSRILLFIHESNRDHNDGYFAWGSSDQMPSDIHNGGTNLSYCDGHVRCASQKQLKLELARGDWASNSHYHDFHTQ